MSAVPILVIGAGPLGLAVALALHQQGRAVQVIDAGPGPGRDARVLALSEGSRQILARLGVWPAAATAIKHIHISQQGGFGRSQLDAQDYGIAALGHVVTAAALTAELAHACQAAGVPVQHGVTITTLTPGPDTLNATDAHGAHYSAQLVIRAEGAMTDGPGITHRDYQQDALVCLATPAAPHQHRAFERFTPNGPYALLPCGAQYSVVVTSPREASHTLLQATDAAFLDHLHAAFGSRVRLTEVGLRARYPLSLRYRHTLAEARQVWLGNAAQTLHPVAGQGFNLALRDLWSLVSVLADTHLADPGQPALLARYEASRKLDRLGTLGFTDALIRVFCHPSPLVSLTRGAGLMALDLLPPARDFVARRMMFGARGL